MNAKTLSIIGALGGILTAWVIFAWFNAHVTPPAAPQEKVANSKTIPSPPRTDLPPKTIPPHSKSPAPQLPKLWKALTEIREAIDPTEAEAQMTALVASIPPQEREAVLNALWSDPRPAWIGDFGLRLIGEWTRHQPQAAAAWTKQAGNIWMQNDQTGRSPAEAPEMRSMFEQVALVWSQADATATLQWASELDPATAHIIRNAVAQTILVDSPQQALAVAMQMPSGSDREHLLRRAISEWAARDSSSAWQWAEALGEIEDIELHRDLAVGLAHTLAAQDPAGAAEFIVTSLDAGRAQNDAVLAVAQKWSAQNPAEAIRWASSFHPGSTRTQTLRTLINNWADSDIEQAGRWIKSVSKDDPDYEALLAVYANKAALHDPPAAASMADSISDANLRASAQDAVASHWLLRDPAVARAWITQTDLPPAHKAQLINP